MCRLASIALALSLAAAALEIHPQLAGGFDATAKDANGHTIPADWVLNTGYARNGTWSAVADTERGGHVLAIAAERGTVHVYTGKAVGAGPGTKATVSLEARGSGTFRVWLYCYGASGGWVGENVSGPTVTVDGPAWHRHTFPLAIPDRPFPKGTVGQIKLALDASKGATLQFDNVTLAMEIAMKPTESTDAGKHLRLLLPPVIHATPGLETNLYFANTVLAINPANYAFDVTCTKGTQQAERWTFTPKDTDVGDAPLTLTVRDDSNTVIASATTLVRVVPSKTAATLRVLMIGDSLTHASHYPAQVLANAEADPQLTVALVGSHRPQGEDSPVRHEGYGGWTAKMFTSYYPDVPPENGRKAHSPFLYRDEAGKPVLDFPRYCREQNVGQPPDVVTVLLGCNDVFGCIDETIADKSAECITNLDLLIQAIHAYGPKTRIGILLPVPPAGSQDAFGANYGCGQTRWQYLRNQRFLLEQMTKAYADRESEGIHLLASFTALDPIHGFPSASVPANSRTEEKAVRLSNGVHPSVAGYQQIGDVISAWLVSLVNQP